jgi:hypothetical protein
VLLLAVIGGQTGAHERWGVGTMVEAPLGGASNCGAVCEKSMAIAAAAIVVTTSNARIMLQYRLPRLSIYIYFLYQRKNNKKKLKNNKQLRRNTFKMYFHA